MIINNKINSSQVSLIIRWIDKQARTMVLTEIFVSYLFSPVRNAISLSTKLFLRAYTNSYLYLNYITLARVVSASERGQGACIRARVNEPPREDILLRSRNAIRNSFGFKTARGRFCDA